MSQKLFSGIQPSGNLHIGNYLGAVKQWLRLQDEYESTFAVMNLHAITTPQEPEKLALATIEIARVYLAAGIDPEKCILFIQSHIPQHVELSWILGTLARKGDLDKMTQFKEKAKSGDETAGIGLYTYPVLQAADILLYDAAVVPVGEDQLQHIELARTLARRFNERFGETFVVPEGRIQKEGARIMGLDDSTKKMSKSAASEYNYISLTDDEATVLRKVKKAVTDSGSDITYSSDRPALQNLINIYSLFSDKSPESVVEMYQGKGYGDFKTDLAGVITEFLKPFQERLASISDDEVKAILEAGAAKANIQAQAKMKLVRERVGLL
jgi:tryptophanyl-tRNA synthetase